MLAPVRPSARCMLSFPTRLPREEGRDLVGNIRGYYPASGSSRSLRNIFVSSFNGANAHFIVHCLTLQ